MVIFFHLKEKKYINKPRISGQTRKKSQQIGEQLNLSLLSIRLSVCLSCVLSQLLSNPDARAFLHFAENSQDGGIHADLIYDRPYDYSSAPEIVTVDRNAKYEFSTLERGVLQGYPLREQQEDKMQYLQVYFHWFSSFLLLDQLN